MNSIAISEVHEGNFCLLTFAAARAFRLASYSPLLPGFGLVLLQDVRHECGRQSSRHITSRQLMRPAGMDNPLKITDERIFDPRQNEMVARRVSVWL